MGPNQLEEQKYGLLIQPTVKLHRAYFEEMCKLQGIYSIYRYPLSDKHFTTYAEIDSSYSKPLLVGCIFEDHPSQQTTKKLGWVSELQETSSIIHVSYDLPHLQIGCLFIIPSGLDNAQGRLFKVVKMSNVMIYPASISCEIVPQYENTMTEQMTEDYSKYELNPLNEESLRVM